jgi:hypothetical protein
MFVLAAAGPFRGILPTPPAGGQRPLPFRARVASANQAARKMRRGRHIDVAKFVKTTHEGIGAINAVQMDEPERPDRDAATLRREMK